MTLIEVLAGLALLATLLASILVAKGQWTRQHAVAQRRLEALRAADSLMSGWWPNKEELVRPDQGHLEALKLNWSKKLIDSNAAKALNSRVMRLEIRDASPSDSENPALASIEVLIPDETANTK